MTPNASTVATVHDAAIPSQRTPGRRRPKTTQPTLFALVKGQYCPLMGDTTGPWGDYIQWAADRVGGVARLAQLTGLNRNTLFRWKRGDNAETPQISHVFAIADAAAGPNATDRQRRAERRRAVLAAGQITDEPPAEAPPAATMPAGDEQPPTLAEALAHINGIADHLGVSGEQRLRAIAEVIRAYEQAGAAQPAAEDGPPRTRRTA